MNTVIHHTRTHIHTHTHMHTHRLTWLISKPFITADRRKRREKKRKRGGEEKLNSYKSAKSTAF